MQKHVNIYMFLTTKTIIKKYKRKSKSGLEHEYSRKTTVALFRCDNCNASFERTLKQINRKRLSNNYFHCCPNCDAKVFAQRKGIEQKKIWNMSAGSNLPVGKF